MRKTWIIVVIIVLVVIVVVFAMKKPSIQVPKEQVNSNTNSASLINSKPPPVREQAVSTENSSSSKVEFTINGGNYFFKPNVLNVKLGDTVTINFKNDGGFHDFKIDEFNVATNQVKDGGEDSVAFVASKKGSFEYYCSVGQHRAMGMKGVINVE